MAKKNQKDMKAMGIMSYTVERRGRVNRERQKISIGTPPRLNTSLDRMTTISVRTTPLGDGEWNHKPQPSLQTTKSSIGSWLLVLINHC